MENIIFHVDVNSAFLSWEAAYRKEVLKSTDVDLREIPAIISGNQKLRHGIVLAASIPAKRFRIRTGEAIVDALKKCPELKLVSPHYNLYERCSHAFLSILREYAPEIEVFSIDECWCNMTGTSMLYGDPIDLAHQIRERISKELGFTVNIGISSNKLLAKMAGDLEKPNRVHTLYPEEIPVKMWPLPVRDLFFVGRATEKKVLALGVNTIGDLAHTDIQLLKTHLGKHGELIHAFANGIDLSDFTPEPPANKGYGNSTTIAFDVTDAEQAKHILLSLCETIGARLRKDRIHAGVISVNIRSSLLQNCSHQMKLLSATNTTAELYHYACILFDELWDHSPIRLLGVHTSALTDEKFHQMTLFHENTYEKEHTLDQTIDTIRNRFGSDSIFRASFLESPIYHMTGGISKTKNGETEFKRGDGKCKRLFL